MAKTKDYAAAVDKFLSRPDEPEMSETSKTSQTSKMSKTSQTPKTHKQVMADCRLTLRINHDDMEYLKQASWEEHQNITDYLRMLIHLDRIAKADKPKSRGKG